MRPGHGQRPWSARPAPARRPSPTCCLRFIEPDSGTILVGELPLTRIDVAAWRSQVGWVPQWPHLFHGTVADNIRLARPDAAHGQT